MDDCAWLACNLTWAKRMLCVYFQNIKKSLHRAQTSTFEVQRGFDNLTFSTCEVYVDNSVLTWKGLTITLSNCLHKKILHFFLFSSVLLWEVNTRVRRGDTGIVFTVYWNRLKSVQFFTSGVAQISLSGSCMSHLNVSRWKKLTFRLYFTFYAYSVQCEMLAPY